MREKVGERYRGREKELYVERERERERERESSKPGLSTSPRTIRLN